MIGSFRTTVALWLEQTLTSDVHVTLPGSDADRQRGSLPPRLLLELGAIAGVTWLSQGRPDELHSPYGAIPALALHDPVHLAKGFRFKHAKDDVWPLFQAGQAVLISESLAYHHGLQVGDTLPLDTVEGARTFLDRRRVLRLQYRPRYAGHRPGDTCRPVAGRRHHHRRSAHRSGRQLPAGPGKRAPGRCRLRQALYLVIANAQIRAQSMAIFDRTFAITGVLLEAVLLAVGAALLAGAYPAWRLATAPPIKALREE